MIEIRDLRKSFAGLEVLRGINLTIGTGEILALVGRSGCGKTTLLRCLNFLEEYDAGEITLNGQVLWYEQSGKGQRKRLSETQVSRQRQRMGVVFQQYNLLPALTAEENAAIPLVAAGMPLEVAAKKAAVLLQQIGMGAHLDKLPNQLSGGQQQRVAIARACVHAPQLIVCDEPTAALDAETGQTVLEILKQAALVPDRAVIVVTHDTRIFRFADSIATMEDGRIGSVRSAPFAQLAEVA